MGKRLIWIVVLGLIALSLSVTYACKRNDSDRREPKVAVSAVQYSGGVMNTSVTNQKQKDWRTFKKPDDATLRKTLSPLQYDVTQKEGTEPPFNNEYYDNDREGIYVDIASGEPLFSSKDKYESGTGWPSFAKPLEPGNIVERKDTNLLMTRTEVRRFTAIRGHVFPDGPTLTGLRCCINSAALRFIPKKDLSKEGYGEYAKLFEKEDYVFI